MPVFFYITNGFNSFFFQLNPSNFGGVLIVAQIFLCSASLVLLKIKGIQISNILFVLGFHYLHERVGISQRHITVSTAGLAAPVTQNACPGHSGFWFPSLSCLFTFSFKQI